MLEPNQELPVISLLGKQTNKQTNKTRQTVSIRRQQFLFFGSKLGEAVWHIFVLFPVKGHLDLQCLRVTLPFLAFQAFKWILNDRERNLRMTSMCTLLPTQIP